MKVTVRTGNNSYAVHVGRGLLAEVGSLISKRLAGRKIFVLTNQTVRALWYRLLKQSLTRAGIQPQLITIGDGERYKNLQVYHQIISQLVAQRADRGAVLLTFGGGVVSDLGGFVAATYKRGIDLVHVPTTLIAQVDAAIGGKTALDLTAAKNILGSFYHPRLVVADPELLSTLPQREYDHGLFEIIKVALVGNRQFYNWFSTNLTGILSQEMELIERMIAAAAKEKIKIVNEDPYDQGRRVILNFGHTFGHALETVGGYRRLGHGEAVGWGMLVALRISELLGYGSWPVDGPVWQLIRQRLPTRRWRLDPDEVWRIMTLDKKAQGREVRFVLLKSIAGPIVRPVKRRTFRRAMENL